MATRFATVVVSAIAASISKVIPQGFSVSGVNGVLEISQGLFSQSDLGAIIDQSFDTGRNVEAAGLCALNAVQDFVSIGLRQPWPSDPLGGSTKMAAAQATVEDRILRLWYGEPDRIVVDVAVIDLALHDRPDGEWDPGIDLGE